MSEPFESSEDSESRFDAYVEELIAVIGHADRAKPLRDYCVGLLAEGERKSVEPMAAITAPERTAAQHQSLLHFVANGPWSDEAVLTRVRELVLPKIERHGRIEAWIVDDTAIPKKGRHSVGVARQYCGRLGKQDNCQVAVSVSVANHAASLPVAYRLYLPPEWAFDDARCRKARVPDTVEYEAKPDIALAQLSAACATDIPRGVVLADPGYGNDGAFRRGVTALGLRYSVGVQSSTTVWAPGTGPVASATSDHADAARPVSVKALALSLPTDAWQTVAWREGTNDTLRSRFARIRVRPANRRWWQDGPPAEEWLLIEWPEDDPEPLKYWMATLAQDISLGDLVDLSKLRWRVERDYEELKGELGLDHYEGRGWSGFHHHGTLCIAAYGFLISERETIPPSEPARAWRRETPALPAGYRPRGAADPTRAPRPELDRDHAATADCRPGLAPAQVPLLYQAEPTNRPRQRRSPQLMTQ